MGKSMKPIPHTFRSTNTLMVEALARAPRRSWRVRLAHWLGVWR